MYQIIEYDTGKLIAETLNVTWVTQQERVDVPVLAYNYNDADGVVFKVNGEEKTLGIKKDRPEGAPNMDNYTPLVRVVEVSGEQYIMQQLSAMQAQVRAMQAQSTTTSEQVNEIYASQAGDVVVKSDLDAAYKEGVNSL